MIDYSDCMMVGGQAQESREGVVSKHDTRARDSVERGDEQSGRALVQSGGGRQSQQGARLGRGGRPTRPSGTAAPSGR